MLAARVSQQLTRRSDKKSLRAADQRWSRFPRYGTRGLFADRYRQETPTRAEQLAFVARRIDTLQLGMSYVVCAHEIREMHDLQLRSERF